MEKLAEKKQETYLLSFKIIKNYFFIIKKNFIQKFFIIRCI